MGVKKGKEQKIDVSIVIPARDEEAHIGECLDAVFGQKTGYSFEVIVIDSGSMDRTVEVVGRYPAVRLARIKPEEFAHGRTRNLGAEMSRGDFIVFLNADALPVNQGWLAPLIDHLRRDPQTAASFSRHIPRPGCHLYMVRDLLDSMPEQPLVRSRVGSLDFMIFSTVSAAVKKEVWQDHPFDDHILIAEDQDWARAVIEKGYKIVYEPGSAVVHSHNYTLKELFEVKRRVGQSTGRFKNRFSACILGFPLIIAGMVVKICGDLLFILFKSPGKIPFAERMKQVAIAAAARKAAFAGRFAGWLSKN